ncbi:MAG: DUF2723 domain-containing protein [Gemmatimonadetes bacterium]|nr:DUF2723 domain-containing protein [Gemmatimonadota bacterium]
MEQRYDPPYVGAVLAALAAFTLYVVTLAPSAVLWDASEYVATAHILGIPHPPGNPLFVVLGRVWSLLLAPLGLPVAVRVNLFAAATSAASTGFLFLVAHRIIRTFSRERWMALAGAGAAAMLGATTYTVWNQSNANEKVYTVSVLVLTAVTWLGILWRDRKDEPGALRYPLIALYLLVLGSTNHLMSVLPLPALGVLALMAGPGFLLRRTFWMRAVPLVALGLSFNFFLPVRAAERPVINEGEPVCESVAGAAAAVYTNGRTGCPALAASLQREQYAKPPVTERQAPVAHQLYNYFQWFDWQWSRGVSAAEVPGNARLPFTLLFLALGVVGLWATYRADRPLFGYLLTLAAVLTFGLVFYLNFRYGFSLRPDIPQELHEVRERDYFFIASFILWGMLAGIGLAWAWSVAASSLRGSRAALLSAPLLLVAAIPLALNWAWASRAGDWAARDWAYDLLMSVEPYGVLFTNGDNDTFPLWYVQEVEGLRRDVTVIVGQYLHTTWYPRQLQALSRPCAAGEDPAARPTVIVCQRPFEAGVADGLYALWAPPTRPILTLSPDQMDLIGGGTLAQDATVDFPQLAVTYPRGTQLDRAHRLTLAIIRDSLGDRPIYFSSAGGLMGELGLREWGVRQGLVTKLDIRRPGSATPESWVQASGPMGGEWFDLPRTLRLWDDVYTFRGIRDRDVWADRSTLNIPWNYYALALQLSDVTARAGHDPSVVGRFEEEAARFAVVAQGGSRGAPPGALPGG